MRLWLTALVLVAGGTQVIVRTPPAPIISSLSVTSGIIGTTVVLTGVHFGSSQGAGSVVFASAVTATPTAWSDISITVTVPLGAVTGPVIVVQNGVTSNPLTFTVTAGNTCHATDLASFTSCLATAVDGDTIAVTAVTMTPTTTLSTSHCVNILGAGATFVGQGPGSTPTVFTDDGTLGNRTMLSLTTPTNGCTMRIAGFQWNVTAASTNVSGELGIGGISHNLRVDHIDMLTAANVVGLTFSGDIWGVVDHSTFEMSAGAELIRPEHPSWQNIGSNADNSWAQDDNWGTIQFIFIEDCTFTHSGGQNNIIDAYSGARYVVRHSTFAGCANIENHGTDSTGRSRGTRAVEIYNNTWTACGSSNTLIDFRSGTFRVHDNVLNSQTATTWLIDAQNFRDTGSFSPWGKCDGTGAYDQNTGGQTGYACIDQPGRGGLNATLLSGTTPAPTGWVNEPLDPGYAWNNTLNGNNLYGSNSLHVVTGTDVLSATPVGYTTFTYPHPLVH